MPKNISVSEKLAELLSKNRAVVIKTDTVYGILALNETLIIKAKSREETNKKTVRLVHSREQISPFLPKDLANILDKYWPGELTVIYNGIGYRCPNHIHILETLKKLDKYIYASSANTTSNPVATSIQEAKKIFKGSGVEIEFIDDDSVSNSGEPSTIYDYDNNKILRKGRIKEKDILKERRKT